MRKIPQTDFNKVSVIAFVIAIIALIAALSSCKKCNQCNDRATSVTINTKPNTWDPGTFDTVINGPASKYCGDALKAQQDKPDYITYLDCPYWDTDTATGWPMFIDSAAIVKVTGETICL